jgi:ribonuclease P protein component
VVNGGGESFPKVCRLLRPSEFDRVYRFRRSAAEGALVLYACPRPFPASIALPAARLGMSVSRRIGNAVVRNAWKRRLREAFRVSRKRIPAGHDYLVVVRSGAAPGGADGAAKIEGMLVALASRIVSRPSYRDAEVPPVVPMKPRHR